MGQGLTFVSRCLYGDGISFANVALLVSTPLNRSLQNFNAWLVLVCNRTLQRDFWVLAPQKLGAQKLPIFDDFATQWQIKGQYLRRGTWHRQSGNSIKNYEGSPTSSQNFINFGPLTAKNRTIVFTHPLKSSAWWRRPSLWPALWCADISSFSQKFPLNTFGHSDSTVICYVK